MTPILLFFYIVAAATGLFVAAVLATIAHSVWVIGQSATIGALSEERDRR